MECSKQRVPPDSKGQDLLLEYGRQVSFACPISRSYAAIVVASRGRRTKGPRSNQDARHYYRAVSSGGDITTNNL